MQSPSPSQVVCIAILLATGTALSAADFNLVTNPDFTIAKDGKPDAWKDAQKRQTVSVDSEEKPPGGVRVDWPLLEAG